MNDSNLIDLFEKVAGIPSDRQAAKRLNVSRTYISDIRNGRKNISEKLFASMATIAGTCILKEWGDRAQRRIMDIM